MRDVRNATCRELLGTLFCARSAPDGPAPDEVRLRPGGSLPMRDQEAPRPIPSGPPGGPRDGNPSSWKEQDNSWRSPFKGQCCGSFRLLQMRASTSQ